MKINVKLSEGAQKPVKGSLGAAGYDLTAVSVEYKQLRNGPIYEYDTGVEIKIPPGYVGLITSPDEIELNKTLELAGGIKVLSHQEDYQRVVLNYKSVNQYFTNLYESGDIVGNLRLIKLEEFELEE